MAELDGGLVAVSRGADLPAEQIAAAYARGLFPMALDVRREEIGWFCPDPRAVVPLDAPHIPKSLRKVVRSGRFEVTADTAFEDVVRACAGLDGAERRPGGWINGALLKAYPKLRAAGHARSLECRRNGRLVGGLYGMAVGAAFIGESMFHLEDDASKTACVHLFARLRAGGFVLLDSQIATDHMRRFGLQEIPRADFLGRLAAAVSKTAEWNPPAEAVEAQLKSLCGGGCGTMAVGSRGPGAAGAEPDGGPP